MEDTIFVESFILYSLIQLKLQKKIGNKIYIYFVPYFCSILATYFDVRFNLIFSWE